MISDVKLECQYDQGILNKETNPFKIFTILKVPVPRLVHLLQAFLFQVLPLNAIS